MLDLGFDTPDYGELEAGDWLDTGALNVGCLAWFVALPTQCGGNTWTDLVQSVSGSFHTNPSGYGLLPASQPGGFGSARFNGSNNYISCGTPAALKLLTNFTLEAWVNTGTISGSPTILCYGGSGYQFRLSNSVGKLELAKSGAGALLTGTTVLSTNTWYHAAVTLSGSGSPWTVNIYLNGQLDKTGTTTTALLSPTQNFCLGVNNNAANSFVNLWSGYLNEVRVYNRVLSAAEIQARYWLSQQGNPGLLKRRRRLYFAPAAGGLAGVASASGQFTATVTGTLSLAGTAQANGSASATVTPSLALSAKASAAGQFGTTVTGTVSLAAKASVQGAGQASAAASLALAGKATAQGQAAASLSGSVLTGLLGKATAQGSFSATARGSVTLAAKAAAQGQGQASATPSLTLAGKASVAGQGAATVSGTVTTPTLAGKAAAQGSFQATVRGTLLLAAQAAAQGSCVARVFGSVSSGTLYPDIIFTEPARPLVFTEPARPLYFSSA